MAAATQQPSVDDLEKKEEELFRTGPLSVLTMSVKNNSQARVALLNGAAAYADGDGLPCAAVRPGMRPDAPLPPPAPLASRC